MDPAGIPALREAIRHLHGCESRFVEWAQVSETFRGQVAWQREVGVFELIGHPKATRAYAWSEPGSGTKRRFFAALHLPPVDGPLAAVRVSILADAKK